MLPWDTVQFTPWHDSRAPMPICTESTEFKAYSKSLEQLIERLRKRGGKTVISKVICGEHNEDMAQVALDFFNAYPLSYRTVFHTAETGTWMGASPELLYKIENGSLYTMALAGTRQYAEDSLPWDSKNIEEHLLVADFIENALSEQHASFMRKPLSTLRYGAIEHLLTEFTADAATLDIDRLRSRLQPTPAVGGYPRECALEDIADIESHSRNMYSGLIEFEDAALGARYCIVNLRCMQFNHNQYCIYAGGGITGDSDPADEWAETEAKSAWLRARMAGNQADTK